MGHQGPREREQGIGNTGWVGRGLWRDLGLPLSGGLQGYSVRHVSLQSGPCHQATVPFQDGAMKGPCRPRLGSPQPSIQMTFGHSHACTAGNHGTGGIHLQCRDLQRKFRMVQMNALGKDFAVGPADQGAFAREGDRGAREYMPEGDPHLPTIRLDV
ncbi:MAG: hypothetical protein EBS08_00990 [Cytophagia bacterium]|nr:hypothetical protein [Cytophagia bacterium]